jgi:hypothetical protein
VPVQRGERGEFLNNLTGWVRVTVIGPEKVVAVQGQVIDIDDLGIAIHQETSSEGAEQVFYPWTRVFSVAPCPRSQAAKT